MLQKVLMMFYSYLRFAIASGAKSLCKTLIDPATSYTTQGLAAIAMHGCKKTKEVPLTGLAFLKSIHEKTHSEDTHREMVSSVTQSARRFPGWANTCTNKWVFTGDLVC